MLVGLICLASWGCFARVGQDGRVHDPVFSLSFPDLLPPLVVVAPGVSVAAELDDELYYSDGWYWARQDQQWFRSHDHRRGWAYVDARTVPGVVQLHARALPPPAPLKTPSR
jgi:hypothetical protein